MSYSSEVLADSPGLYLRCDQASGNLTDSSGNGNTVTPDTAPTYSQTGLIASDPTNTCVRLNGGFDSFVVTDSASVQVGDVFTLECWLKANTSSTDRWIIDRGGNTATGGFALRVNTSNNLEVDRSTVQVLCVSTVTLSNATTYHCVATKNGATVKLYVNGVDVSGSVTNSTCDNYAHNPIIGIDINYVKAGFDGWIDEVAIYPTALSAARVLAHYNASGLPLQNIDFTCFPKPKMRSDVQ